MTPVVVSDGAGGEGEGHSPGGPCRGVSCCAGGFYRCQVSPAMNKMQQLSGTLGHINYTFGKALRSLGMNVAGEVNNPDFCLEQAKATSRRLLR